MTKQDWMLALTMSLLMGGVLFLSFVVIPQSMGKEKYHHEGEGAKVRWKSTAPPRTEAKFSMTPALSFRRSGIYPCSDCHDPEEDNPKRRELTEDHKDILFDHDPKRRWCLDCHDFQNRDKLRLASGKLIDFRRSELLCQQCHGKVYRDWEAGIHGKQTGGWLKGKKRWHCSLCHDPHVPKFAPLPPLPPPVRDGEIQFPFQWKF